MLARIGTMRRGSPLVCCAVLLAASPSLARDVGEYQPGSVGRLGARHPLMSPASRNVAVSIAGPAPVVAVDPGQFALLDLIGQGDGKALQALTRRVSVPSRLPDGRSPLVAAVETGMPELVRILLDAGASPASKDGFGRTPLGLAALGGHARIVQLLLAKGAPVSQREDNGATPLHHAAALGHASVVDALALAGADLSMRDRFGHTALIAAVRAGRESTVARLLQRGADPNLAGRDGFSPLYWAVYRGHRDIAHRLVDAGAVVGAVSLEALDP